MKNSVVPLSHGDRIAVSAEMLIKIKLFLKALNQTHLFVTLRTKEVKIMDSETRRFLSQSILFNCPECNAARSYKLDSLGKRIVCKKCGHIVEISKHLTIDLEPDDELRKDIEEYLNELRNS